MNSITPDVPPGKRLKKLRLSVGLSTREVERRSRQVIKSRRNPEFLVSHSWLLSIEEGRNIHTPSIYKFYTLSALYNRSSTELASYFGVPFSDVGKDRALFEWSATHLIDPGQEVPESSPSAVPSPGPTTFNSDNTLLLTELAQIWGDIPSELIRKLDTAVFVCLHRQKGFHSLPGYSPGLLRPDRSDADENSQERCTARA